MAYLEAQGETRYQLLPLLQFADLFMEPLREQYDWGISLPQMISGILHCHPNYPTNLLDFKMHTADDIYRMLKELPEERKGRYKKPYMDEARTHFLSQKVKQEGSLSEGLDKALVGCDSILLLCGGGSVDKHQVALKELVEKEKCLTITVNNPAPPIHPDAVFFGNQRRLLKHIDAIQEDQEVIFGPTISEGVESRLNLKHISRLRIRMGLSGDFAAAYPMNSAVMAILAAQELGAKTIYVAGMDGLQVGGDNYYYKESDGVYDAKVIKTLNEEQRNELGVVKKLIQQQGVSVKIVTPTIFTEFQ